MGGKVKWHEDQNKVVITEDEQNGSRLILTGVNSKRQESGTEVKEGELIGKATGSTLIISYEKYNEDKKIMRASESSVLF